MSNAANTIVPASNFEARKLDGFAQSFPGAEIRSTGWGVWDCAAKAWVSMNDRCEVLGRSVPVPYSLRTREAARRVFADGLRDDYQTVA